LHSSDISSYVINLKDRHDRRAEMEVQLRRIGWHSQFEPACRPTSADGFPSIGARGCFLSHLSTLQRGAATNTHVLIMEDDLDFAPGFEALWDRAYAQLQQNDWSIFYPGHTLNDLPAGLNPVSPTTGMLCAHFVLFNRTAVPILIEGLLKILSRSPGDPLGGPMHVDGAYSTIRAQNPALKTYAYSPTLGKQRPSRSDITDPKFHDKIAILRSISSGLRRVKRHFLS
jgi:hypothetical protein